MRLFQLSIFALWVNCSNFILDFGHLCPNYYWLETFLILLIFIRKQLLVSLIFWIIFFFYMSLISKLLSRVQLSMTPWTAAPQASLSFTISRGLLKLMSIELVIPSNHLILCHPLLFLPSVFPSIRVFSSESALRIRWQRIGASASLLPMNLISLLSKGLSRVFSSTTLWKQFFSAQPSSWSSSQHPYVTTGKTTRR